MPLSITENLTSQASDLFPYSDDIQFLQNTAPRSSAYYRQPDYLQASFCHTQNDRYRSTMEDASKVILNYQNTPGNGYFAIFDGHAGSFTSKWCAANMNKLLSQNLTLLSQRTFASSSPPSHSIPSILAFTFDQANQKIISSKDYDNSGCTASVVYLKTERIYPDTGLYLSTPSSSFNHQQLPRNRRRYSSFSPASPQFFVSSPTLNNNMAPSPGLNDNRFQKINTSTRAPTQPNYIHTSRTLHPSTLSKARDNATLNNANFSTFDSTTSENVSSTTNPTDRTGPVGASGNNMVTIRKTLYTANVGDSAIVICNNGRAQRLTRDHRAIDQVEADRIRAAGGTVEHGRVDKSLSVTRALGDQPFKPYVSARPFTAELQIEDSDEFIVIACDGVWDVCSDQSVIDLIRDVENTDEAAREIVRHALKRGSTDNVTCMVVRLKPTAECKEQLPAVAKARTLQDCQGAASSIPISIPNSSCNSDSSTTTSGSATPQQLESRVGSPPVREISFIDTIEFPAHQLHISLPLRRDPVIVQEPTHARRQRVSSMNTLNPNTGDLRLDTLSPMDSDLTISEEDDEEESMVPGISIEEEDLEQAIADDDDGIFDMQQPSDDVALNSSSLRPSPDLFRHHRSATSFTVDHQRPRFRRDLFSQQQHQPRSTPVFGLEQESQVSKLDRYGRFKRSVQLEFNHDGVDECAITDGDSD